MCVASIVQMRNAERGMRNLNHSDQTARIQTIISRENITVSTGKEKEIWSTREKSP
jgi:hypothetical protein